MKKYNPEGWKILSHAVLISNMYWNTSILHFNEAKYDEWLEKFGPWDGTAEHVTHTMTFEALTDATHNFPLPL